MASKKRDSELVATMYTVTDCDKKCARLLRRNDDNNNDRLHTGRATYRITCHNCIELPRNYKTGCHHQPGFDIARFALVLFDHTY